MNRNWYNKGFSTIQNLFVLEEFDSCGIEISFPDLRHTADSSSAEYSNGDNGAEHHRCLNSICPDNRFQTTLE